MISVTGFIPDANSRASGVTSLQASWVITGMTFAPFLTSSLTSWNALTAAMLPVTPRTMVFPDSLLLLVQ